jgi:hypothetical protein
MSISSVSGVNNTSQVTANTRMDQFKQTFDSLGSALKSGDLEAAKKAYTELQKNAPSQKGNSSNPMAADMETLGKALESGDVKAAQDAYSTIQSKMTQGRPAEAQGSKPQNGAKPSGGASTSSSSKTYDKKDLNEDGTVTALEKLMYEIEHPEAASTKDSELSDVNKIDTYI